LPTFGLCTYDIRILKEIIEMKGLGQQEAEVIEEKTLLKKQDS
jgi:hypothetical protein